MTPEQLEQRMRLQIPDESPSFTSDQASVFEAYHYGSGQVCVGAGAGTGKTTTLTRVVAETVLREYSQYPNSNPFDTILATTFTVDAAGQLKSDIKSVLREHEEASDTDLDQELWRWVETENHIHTIDSFINELLYEIAADAGVNADFDIADELEKRDIRDQTIYEIRNETVADDWSKLQDAFEDRDEDLRELVYEAQQKFREFCADFSTLPQLFENQIRRDLHDGFDSPLDASAIADIAEKLTGEYIDEDDLEDETVEAINQEYTHNLEISKAFGRVVQAFEQQYDEITREEGLFSYQDVTYLVWEFLQTTEGQRLANSLSNRFSHVFIDEFQDTSHAQCEILSELFADGSENNVMIIGDVKQSIYTWRSADPEIFNEILDHAERDLLGPDPHLGLSSWEYQRLDSNFRSHPQIVRVGNHLFSNILEHPGRGDMGRINMSHQPLAPQRADIESDEPHTHIIPFGDEDIKKEEWENLEPDAVAETIRGIVDGDTLQVVDRDESNPMEDDPALRPAEPGDFTLLFCRSTNIPNFREALDSYGLENAVVADRGLFKAREVGFIIDVLDWFAHPHSKDSLLRILRSPITALDDKTLRFIASHEHDLSVTLQNWDSNLPDSDRKRLKILLNLRSDLRWDREGSKAELVQRIIQHTGIETILLTADDPRQRYGNLWMLVEVVRDWEEEELLPYREFVSRLRRYQGLANESGRGNFEVAQTADSESDETVKLRTVHSAKGLEFNITVVADLLAGPVGPPWRDTLLRYRDETRREVVLRPQPISDGISFDPGPGSSWNPDPDGRGTGPLWPSKARSGAQLRYPHPYNPAIEDFYAEYWRLLYVAITRASDHLILPLGNDSNKRWDSWGYPLIEHLREGDTWESEISHRNQLQGQHPDDEDKFSSVPLGIGTLTTGKRPEQQTIGLPEKASDTTRDVISTEWEGIPFAPNELRPSELYNLVACPLRYQYGTLQEVSEARGDTPPNTNKPSSITSQQWGRFVHEALSRVHAGQGNDSNQLIEDYFDQLSDTVADRIEPLIAEYKRTPTWEETKAASHVLSECELSARYSDEIPVEVTGRIDLLYELRNQWNIVDFKTGTIPPENSALLEKYRWQLTTYAWLLQSLYDIHEINAQLVYVKSGDRVDVDVSSDDFDSFINRIESTLDIVPRQGLEASPDPEPGTTTLDELDSNPTSLCGTCPFTDICPEWEQN